MTLPRDEIREAVRRALAEDLGPGDVTSEALIPRAARGRAFIVCRAPGIVAGLAAAKEVFRQLRPSASFKPLTADGRRVRRGEKVAEIAGPVRTLLAGERTALNFIQRLSGIATLTRRCVEAVAGRDVKILDTRKTTPGLRALEKYAVRAGGGTNHRMGLYDQVLIKDNHLNALLAEARGDRPGAIRRAVLRARERAGKNTLIEVEAESLPMVEAAIAAGADIIMLDNMTPARMREAARRVRAHRKKFGARRPITEASGGVTPDRLARIAATGVDTISLGMLTHSAPAADFAMDLAAAENGWTP
ncbi:MAG: carboxylating nicotinate-nucleotide diphosphorylase [Candidatus Brocadiia bacterium]